jgi:hypothetical protein
MRRRRRDEFRLDDNNAEGNDINIDAALDKRRSVDVDESILMLLSIKEEASMPMNFSFFVEAMLKQHEKTVFC